MTETRWSPPLVRFCEAIDAHTMGARLSAALSMPAAPCHVLDAKYQPGASATVLYDLAGHLVRGDLRPCPGVPRSEDGAGGHPGLSLHRFPHDPDLVSLPAVMDPTFVGPVLATAMSRNGSAGLPVRGAGWRTALLRYRPGKRATVSVTYGPQGRSFVAKVYHDPAKAAAVAAEAPALASATRSSAVLKFAPVVAHLSDLGTVVLGTVTGTPLGALVDTPRGPTRAARPGVCRAARAVAELHDRCPATSRQRSVERELHRFVQRGNAIRDVSLLVGHELLLLAERLLHDAATLPDPQLGTVHGDCKPGQFFLAGPTVYLLDVDHVGVSDLVADVGTFMASLRQLAVRSSAHGREGAAEEYHRLAEAFLHEYVDARDAAVDKDRVRWQEAVALERKALRAFARAPRSPLVTGLIAEAHRCLDRMGGGRAHG